jgi:hypothetical protein
VVYELVLSDWSKKNGLGLCQVGQLTSNTEVRPVVGSYSQSVRLKNVHKDMAEVGKDLSKRLRDPEGEYKCDLIIALTHSR